MSGLKEKLYEGFQGGMNTSTANDALKDNEAILLKNLEYKDAIAFSTRPGCVKVNQNLLGTTITHLNRYTYKGNELIFAVGKNKQLYILEGDQLVSKYTLQSEHVDSFIHLNRLYIADGTDIHVWGDYDYDNAIQTTVTLLKDEIVFNSKPSTGGGIDGHFYKAKNALGSVNLQTADFSNVTNYEDVTLLAHTASNVLRKLKGLTTYDGLPITDNQFDQVKKCTHIVQHSKSRRFFAYGNPSDPLALYISEPNEPAYFKSDGIFLPTHPEKKIHAVIQFSEAMLVSYRNVWYYWDGFDFTDAYWKPINLTAGATNQHAVVLTDNSMTYWSHEGIIRVHVSILNNEVVMLQDRSVIDNVSYEVIDNIVSECVNPGNVQTIYENNKIYFAFATDPLKPDENNSVLVYNFHKDVYSLYEGWVVNCWLVYDDRIIFGSQNFILETLREHFADVDVLTGDEKSIFCEVVSKGYHLDAGMATKQIVLAYFLFKQMGNQSAPVSLQLQFDSQVVDYGTLPIAQNFIWGDLWGTRWSFKDHVEIQLQVNQLCSRVTARITAECLHTAVSLYALGFVYKVTKLRTDTLQNVENWVVTP